MENTHDTVSALPLRYFVSTDVRLTMLSSKRAAMSEAKAVKGDVHVECQCGCGAPAAKPIRTYR